MMSFEGNSYCICSPILRAKACGLKPENHPQTHMYEVQAPSPGRPAQLPSMPGSRARLPSAPTPPVIAPPRIQLRQLLTLP